MTVCIARCGTQLGYGLTKLDALIELALHCVEAHVPLTTPTFTLAIVAPRAAELLEILHD